MAPRLVLVGPPGSGKSTVSRRVAALWDVRVRDTDDDIEAEAGKRIADIFVDDGEEHFRALERAAVSVALQGHDGVLAVGGGAILDESTRAQLETAQVVFLDVGITAAAKRIGFNRDRPLLLGNPRAQWIRLMEARRPFYEQIATYTVSTDGKSADEVAREVVARVPA